MKALNELGKLKKPQRGSRCDGIRRNAPDNGWNTEASGKEKPVLGSQRKKGRAVTPRASQGSWVGMCERKGRGMGRLNSPYGKYRGKEEKTGEGVSGKGQDKRLGVLCKSPGVAGSEGRLRPIPNRRSDFQGGGERGRREQSSTNTTQANRK